MSALMRVARVLPSLSVTVDKTADGTWANLRLMIRVASSFVGFRRRRRPPDAPWPLAAAGPVAAEELADAAKADGESAAFALPRAAARGLVGVVPTFGAFFFGAMRPASSPAPLAARGKKATFDDVETEDDVDTDDDADGGDCDEHWRCWRSLGRDDGDDA